MKTCPSCGADLGRRNLLVDYSYDKKKVPWYKPVGPRLSCRACNTELRAITSWRSELAMAALVMVYFPAIFWLRSVFAPDHHSEWLVLYMSSWPVFMAAIVVIRRVATQYVRANGP